jgi:hypothetical protein
LPSLPMAVSRGKPPPVLDLGRLHCFCHPLFLVKRAALSLLLVADSLGLPLLPPLSSGASLCPCVHVPTTCPSTRSALVQGPPQRRRCELYLPSDPCVHTASAHSKQVRWKKSRNSVAGLCSLLYLRGTGQM